MICHISEYQYPSRKKALVFLINVCASITFAGAEAEESVALKGLPNYRILLSSHAAASAAMLSYLGVWKNDKRPPEVLIGGLEARMYRCICDDKSLHVWEIARGLREWANLEGWQIKVEERCLHSAKPEEIVDWNDLCGELKAERPALASFSFDEASRADLLTSSHSPPPQRFTSMIVGIRSDGKRQELLLQLPLGWEEKPEAANLQKTLSISAPKGKPAPNTVTLAWPPKCPNVVFTFVRELRRQGSVKP